MPIVLLTGQGPLSWIVANGLRKRLGSFPVIKEEPESKRTIIRRRARILGWPDALGQAAFGVLQRLQSRRHNARLQAIWDANGLDPRPDPSTIVHRVPSVNSEECRTLVEALDPRVVAVYGTRIIKRPILAAVGAPFINYHAGMNPTYRGQHPAYWALASGDSEHAGVTIHLIDEGVDTGEVLYQAPVMFSAEDSISTYQHLQAATAIPLFARAIEDALADRLRPTHVAAPSRQWFPPTIWGYLIVGIRRRVW